MIVIMKKMFGKRKIGMKEMIMERKRKMRMRKDMKMK
jgi:hypothetical protein